MGVTHHSPTNKKMGGFHPRFRRKCEACLLPKMRQIHEADETSTHQKRSKNWRGISPAASWKADVWMMKFESEDLWRLFKANSEFSQICFFWWSEIPPKINYRNEQLKFVWTFWGCLVGRLVGWYVHDCSLSLRLYFSTKCCGQQSALLRTPFGWTGILQLFLTCCFSFQGEGQERLEDLKNP